MDFLKQANEPLFPDILWEKPINQRAAKSLLIIGGHTHHFKETQSAYLAAKAAGIGQAKVVLPDSIHKLTGSLPDCLFVPSTPSGSISKPALEQVTVYIEESDGVLLAGELSTNPETISFLERAVSETTKPLIIGQEVVESLLFNSSILFSANKLLAASIQTMVKIANLLKLPIAIKPNDSLMNKINFLNSLANAIPNSIIALGDEMIIAADKQVSLTIIDPETAKQPGKVLAVISTFYLQHPKTFEALTTAAFSLAKQ